MENLKSLMGEAVAALKADGAFVKADNTTIELNVENLVTINEFCSKAFEDMAR